MIATARHVIGWLGVALLGILVAVLTAEPVESAPLIDDLGGAEGFGEPVFFDSEVAFDLTEAAEEGLLFYGRRFTRLFVSEWGMLLFERFTLIVPPWSIPIPDDEERDLPPRIAVYQILSALGSYPFDHPEPFMFAASRAVEGGHQFVATWRSIPNQSRDAIGQVRLNSWQAIISVPDDVEDGDFDVEFRFARCEWIDRPGQSTLFRPLIGFDAAEGEGGQHWLMAESNSPLMRRVCELSNVREPGVFRYRFRGGLPFGCGNDLPLEDGPDRCVDDDNNMPGDGCSAACYREPDADNDNRTEAPHPQSVDPLGVYDGCIDPDEPLCDDDPDGDRVPSHIDNCPNTPNPDQHSYDGDGAGDACDLDADGDNLVWPYDPELLPNEYPDACPFLRSRGERQIVPGVPRFAQVLDQDRDGLGDPCDPDDDGDGVDDCGGDGLCAVLDNGYDDDRDDLIDEAGECDPDDEDYVFCLRGDQDMFDNDADGWIDERDERPLERVWWPGPDVAPARLEDNCRLIANPGQIDRDGDLIGDACDPDPDGDDVASCVGGVLCGPARDGRDNDADGAIDEAAECQSGCDPTADLIDQDQDGYVDEALEADAVVPPGLPLDNCPFLANPDQVDSNGDGIGDLCADDDVDGIRGLDDNCIGIANPEQADLDGDSLGDACDPDDDGDGVDDGADLCPRQADDQADLDGDGLGDACDPDDDEDGVNDPFDLCPRAYDPDQADLDGDGLGDVCDPDDDEDGTLDEADGCPRLPDDQVDTDADGQGDACDPDDDGDGIDDAIDGCPLTADADQADLDGDGVGDVCDPTDNRPFDRRTPDEQCAILLTEGSSTARRLRICPAPTVDTCRAMPGVPTDGWPWLFVGMGLLMTRRLRAGQG